MANNLPGLKTDITAAFGANLDAATRQKLRDRFVASYQNEWDARVAGGVTDNAANRGTFAVDKLFDYLQDIYRSGHRRELEAALTAAEEIN